MASKSPLQTVRYLLRLLKTPSLAPHLQAKAAAAASPASRYNATQLHVLKRIRSSSNNESTSHHKLLLQYYELQRDLHARAKLYALDTGAENQLDAREMSRRAAARAGLQLPIIREELQQDDHHHNTKK